MPERKIFFGAPDRFEGDRKMPKSEKTKPRRPSHTVRYGAVEAAVWQNEGKGGAFYATTFKRSYRDGEEWKDSDSYGERDLLNLARCALDAQAFIAQQMREAARERAA
jgi:hypothetical protein